MSHFAPFGPLEAFTDTQVYNIPSSQKIRFFVMTNDNQIRTTCDLLNSDTDVINQNLVIKICKHDDDY